MAVVLQPWQILIATMAGWISRQHDTVLEYLREENHSSSNSSGTNDFD